MLRKILIANRGEIAVRIIRACKEMGIETVAIYSTADNRGLHVDLADEAICVGPTKIQDSYLNINNILSAAISTGCDAIHPGFGFLSENSTFASLVEELGLKFIGPKGSIIDNMGNKSKAREMMIAANVPVVPGSDGLIESIEQGKRVAKEIGYPVLVKASAGGGGRGMRVINSEDEFEDLFQTAKLEAKMSFGDDSMYMEKFIENPRHIEFQILADQFGNVVHLYDRDCSVQRRNQKVIEEAPSPVLDELTRQKMGEIAVLAAKTVGYENAGTIEFLLDKHQNFYFIEMNTRIQVEHPITEMITGIDLIKEQIKIASNLPLSFTQEDIKINGHAMECRINAENPSLNFKPSPGTVETFNIPSGFGVRVDTSVYQGYTIPPFYDSMVGKLIVHGANRCEAIAKMKRSLEELVVDGIDTNIDFQYAIMEHKNFIDNKYDTSFIQKHMHELEG
ncbi:MAG: acetyl-CoA carboxylase biotin carboxylase subunit [Turicibacter sanguinis]|uniref:Biotin carboxylase n=1 Tax=Turicibacter sanguinis TaxID=154288 RepID=A0A9X5AQP6_9FIRM|nr:MULTISPECIES: acetyl-CoA carboxylase biotin carboxylase subunit [Turicibacter]EGC91160.1 acetyl-CoA carboxylase, biotin carboxylase subunit [Turicibacter sp. HGF1]MBP3903026.1 acetyl-CoA carboxylase biotin carboxylase subunit [Turicibacter sp.]MCU7192516.1 acetyl-CoA carboxylase biotin carboxylase subunit [Turicibacter sanguinis]MCU7195618.1 acetyl-CoA carboxylase biotin carboxylase subunit [Turicibacter sanguinis]MCU7203332.1 acetyl-CoA carboxylase biotin carboxylase subunit [Turicibacter 